MLARFMANFLFVEDFYEPDWLYRMFLRKMTSSFGATTAAAVATASAIAIVLGRHKETKLRTRKERTASTILRDRATRHKVKWLVEL